MAPDAPPRKDSTTSAQGGSWWRPASTASTAAKVVSARVVSDQPASPVEPIGQCAAHRGQQADGDEAGRRHQAGPPAPADPVWA